MEDLSTYKELQDLGNLELLAQQVVEGFITGLHKSPFHGFSVEFAEHRLYNNGESVKNIDWKLFARTDKLFVKRFEEETNLRCQVVIDVSSSMYFPDKAHSKLLFSIYSAASLMYLLKKQRDAFGLSLFAEDVLLNTPAKSTTAHLKYLFTELERVMEANDRNVKTAVAASLHHIAEQIHQRSLVIVFSDMFDSAMSDQKLDDLFAALQHLKFNKHEVVIINVADHGKELDFDFDNRPYHFVDMESGEEVKVHPSHVKDAYLEALGAYQNAIQLKCAQYSIDMVNADINKGFYQVLQTYLIKRQRLG